jgi:hypothetical protein
VLLRRMEACGCGAHRAAVAQATRRRDDFTRSSSARWRLSRLARSVVAAAASGQHRGGRPRWAQPRARRQRGGDGRARPGSAVEADKSKRGHGGEFYFFWQGADEREPRRDSEWERRVHPHGRPCEIIIVEKLEWLMIWNGESNSDQLLIW